MNFDNLKPDLSLLYIKAKKQFEKCICDKDNEFLRDEVNIPLENIIIIEKSIKIVFSQRAFQQYLFEVNLVLLDGEREIGRFLYVESRRGEAIDDSLVFY